MPEPHCTPKFISGGLKCLNELIEENIVVGRII